MRPAAELAGEGRLTAADLDDPDDVAVLLAEEHHRAEVARLIDRRDEGVHGQVLEDRLVDDRLDPLALLVAQRLAVREVEAQLVRANRRAGLVHVVAEHLAERLVQQVRRRVVRHRREADVPRNGRLDPVAGGESCTLEEERLVVAEAERGDELRPTGHAARLRLDRAQIRHLAAALGIEGRLAELDEEEAVLELLERTDLCQHLGLLVADEVGLEAGFARELRRPLELARLTGARPLALLGHQTLELVLVDRQAALERELARQLEREAVRVVEAERVLARDAFGAAREHLVEQSHAGRERLGEALLLRFEHPVNLAAMLDQLRVRVAPEVDHDVRQAAEERRLEPDPGAVLDCPAHDAPQHVATPLVRRADTVGRKERHRTTVVGEHPVRLRRLVRLAVARCRSRWRPSP